MFLRLLNVILISKILTVYGQVPDRPNLIIIQTDEHNLRTLGCYREQMYYDQQYIWGNGIKVDTPHIDSLAKEGALLKNYYTVAPLCTPSRSSFLTGLYPHTTGTEGNNAEMSSSFRTYADFLMKLRGYYTAYIGKFHLDGKISPGFGEFQSKFGFYNRKYLYNRGVWKWFETDSSGNVKAYTWGKGQNLFRENPQSHYITDFLVDRAMEVIKGQVAKNKHFVLHLSIHDPHGPNDVRAPYDTMFDHFTFEVPKSANAALLRNPALPPYENIPKISIKNANWYLTTTKNSEKYQRMLRNIFGMVKNVDDNVGRILNLLKSLNIEDNTIVVMTSDHGDLMFEHAKYNKNSYYRTSAGIPLIIRYPQKIRPGKKVKTAYSTVDFVPTILGLMGINSTNIDFDHQGIDFSNELISSVPITANPKTVRFIADVKLQWICAFTLRYKYVVSTSGPWLYDLQNDPDELYNVINDYQHNDILSYLQEKLYDAMIEYEFPIRNNALVLLWDPPACVDSIDVLSTVDDLLCSDLQNLNNSSKSELCQVNSIASSCPVTCNSCCRDSIGKIMVRGNFMTCDDVRFDEKSCNLYAVNQFCPKSCGLCGDTSIFHKV